MKPVSILFLALTLLLSPAFSRAQSTTAADPSLGVAGMEGVQIAPDSKAANLTLVPNACPIGLRALHLPDGDLVKTGLAHPIGIGQALHLAVPGSTHGLITEATIIRRGWTPTGHVSQTASDKSSDATRTQKIKFVPGANESATADVWIPGLSAITSVEVASAKFADGFAWSRSGSSSCRIQPELLMRVHH